MGGETLEISAEAVAGAIATNPILGVIILLCLGATVVNGATDAPNAIATVVGTRAMRPGPAIIMAAACNFIGMILITMVSTAVASTIFGMVDFGGDNDAALIALQGGLSGVNFDQWAKVLYGLVISTGLGFGTGWLFSRLIKVVCRGVSRRGANAFFKWAQIAAGAGVAMLHGAQDGQKFLSLTMLAVMLGVYGTSSMEGFPIWMVVLVSLTMSFGTAVGGRKIIKSVGMNMVKMDQRQGFAACLSACFCIGLATFTGMPVSTTHSSLCSFICWC